MHTRFLLLVACFIGMISASPQTAFSAAAAWRRDELVQRAEVIAVVEIHERVFPKISGSVLDDEGRELPTALIFYATTVQEILYGAISKEPLIVQFDGAGDVNLFEKGRYLVFLRTEGHLFTPITTAFRIHGDKVLWYRKSGDGDPSFDEVPLKDALREVKALIGNLKKSKRNPL